MKSRIRERYGELKELASAGLLMAPYWLEAAEFDRPAYWLRRGLNALLDGSPSMASMNTLILAKKECERGRSTQAIRLVTDAFQVLSRACDEGAGQQQTFPDVLALHFHLFGDQFEDTAFDPPPVAVRLLRDFVAQHLDPDLLPTDTNKIRPRDFKRVQKRWNDKRRSQQAGEDFLSGHYVAVVIIERVLEAELPLFEERVRLVRASSEEEARAVAAKHVSEPLVYESEAGEAIKWQLKEVVDVSPVLDMSLDEVTDIYARHFHDWDAYAQFEVMRRGERL